MRNGKKGNACGNRADIITARMTKEMQELCPLYTRAKVIDGILWGLGRKSAAEA